MLACAYLAQDQASFQMAEEKLKRTFHISVDDDTIRKAADCVGKLVFEEDRRIAEEIWEAFHTKSLPATLKKRKGTLYIAVHGSFLNTRRREEGCSTRTKNRVGIFFTVDENSEWKNREGTFRGRLEKKEFISYLGSVSEFKKHLLAAAVRNGYDSYEKVILLSDGAEWISRMKEELFGDSVVLILDFLSLRDAVYSFGKAKYKGDESRYVPWAWEVCKKLKDGRWKEVLSELNSSEIYKNTVNLYHYIEINQNYINYPQYWEQGYLTDSGIMESGDKRSLETRFQQTGMRWGLDTAQYLIALAAKQESGLWESDVVKRVHHVLG